MSAFEIKIVAPELASALNRLADAIAGQGQLPLTGTTEITPTSELAKQTTKTEEPKKTTARKSKPAAEEKTAAGAGDAEPAEDTSSSSTSQNDEPQVEEGDDDLTGTETVSVEALGKAITDAVAAGHRAGVVEILKSFDAKRGSDVAEESRADCYAQITDLTKEG